MADSQPKLVGLVWGSQLLGTAPHFQMNLGELQKWLATWWTLTRVLFLLFLFFVPSVVKIPRVKSYQNLKIAGWLKPGFHYPSWWVTGFHYPPTRVVETGLKGPGWRHSQTTRAAKMHWNAAKRYRESLIRELSLLVVGRDCRELWPKLFKLLLLNDSAEWLNIFWPFAP